MSKFNELMQKFVNMEYEELVRLAQASIAEILPACKAVDEKNNGMLMLSAILLSAVAADGKLTAKENQFLKDCTGFTDEQVDTYTDMYVGKMDEVVDSFVDALDPTTSSNVLIVVTAIAACDEKISREENAFIQKLLAR